MVVQDYVILFLFIFIEMSDHDFVNLSVSYPKYKAACVGKFFPIEPTAVALVPPRNIRLTVNYPGSHGGQPPSGGSGEAGSGNSSYKPMHWDGTNREPPLMEQSGDSPTDNNNPTKTSTSKPKHHFFLFVRRIRPTEAPHNHGRTLSPPPHCPDFQQHRRSGRRRGFRRVN